LIAAARRERTNGTASWTAVRDAIRIIFWFISAPDGNVLFAVQRLSAKPNPAAARFFARDARNNLFGNW